MASDSRVTCLFWNVDRQDRRTLVATLAGELQANIVVLAEPGTESELMLSELRQIFGEPFGEPASGTPRLQLFVRDPELDLREVYGDASGRVSIRLLEHQDTEFLLAVAHLPSKVNWTPDDQAVEVSVLAEQIRDEEDRRGHRRTILVGDLNMNPFEKGVVQSSGLHAMMAKSSVVAGSRTVQNRAYPFFYNPMWGFFGDRTQGPPGTLYYRHPGHLSYDWNMFDQVLFRADVLPWFRGDVEIVTKVREIELLGRNGRPDREIGSDHLPIVFRLEVAPANE